jgi:hypothetical protein
MQLPVADVDRDHTPCAVLQERIREPARGGAEVEAVATVELDLHLRERIGELLAAARDVPRRRLDRELRAVVDLVAGLLVARHEAGQDERLGLCAALGEAPFDQQDVEPLLHV